MTQHLAAFNKILLTNCGFVFLVQNAQKSFFLSSAEAHPWTLLGEL